MSALVVENEFAKYVAPSCPSKVPVQFPVVSRKFVEIDVVAPTTPIEFVARRPERTLVMAREVVVALVESSVGKVFTAVVVAVKFAATTSPTTESFANGVVVPMPMFPT